MAYGPDGVFEQEVSDLGILPDLRRRWPVTWLNVEGVGDVQAIRRIGEIFGLHLLALEDAVNVHERAKVEQYENHLFIVARMFEIHGGVETDQLGLFLGKNFVVTFQETPGDCFDPVRDRIRSARGKVRELGADYLAYALLDAVIDAYFPIIEAIGERIEALEDEVLARPHAGTVSQINEMRRELLALRRAIWPLREAIGTCLREPSSWISEDTRVFLRDCYDHTFQVIDLVETYREVGAGLMEIYLSSVGNRTNEVMKVLTIIATIFIPLTFIAGVYGMNFKTERSPWNMPELEWYWGYPACLALMAAVSCTLLFYFWRKGWLGGGGSGGKIARGIGAQGAGAREAGSGARMPE
jgi:magnesium transporter